MTIDDKRKSEEYFIALHILSGARRVALFAAQIVRPNNLQGSILFRFDILNKENSLISSFKHRWMSDYSWNWPCKIKHQEEIPTKNSGGNWNGVSTSERGGHDATAVSDGMVYEIIQFVVSIIRGHWLYKYRVGICNIVISSQVKDMFINRLRWKNKSRDECNFRLN